MNNDLVVYEMGFYTNPVEDNSTIQLDLVDVSQMSQKVRSRCPVFITLDKSRSAELFAGELRDAANDIDRWIRQMRGCEK
jgi:hypothetical protein